MSLPIAPEDRHKYTVTQLLEISFAGRATKALLSSGPKSGEVLYVKGLKYKMQKLSHLIEPTDDDAPSA
jgi:hypothetical protein